MLAQLVSLLIGLVFAFLIIAVRMKASAKPANAKKIILPPFFMATGFLMFLAPEVRVPWLEFFEAFFVGVLFSIFLIKTSKFEVRKDAIYLKRSRAFIFILIGLLIIRTVMKIYLEKSINLPQTSGLFFTLAFGMILPWRLAMSIQYFRLLKRIRPNDIYTTT